MKPIPWRSEKVTDMLKNKLEPIISSTNSKATKKVEFIQPKTINPCVCITGNDEYVV